MKNRAVCANWYQLKTYSRSDFLPQKKSLHVRWLSPDLHSHFFWELLTIKCAGHFLSHHLTCRIGWGRLVTHPFWEGALQDLVKELETGDNPDAGEIRRSTVGSLRGSLVIAAAAEHREHQVSSVFGNVQSVELNKSSEHQTLDLSEIERPGKRCRLTSHREAR